MAERSTPSAGTAWPLTVLTSLFFLWGFMTVMNDVLIPHLKRVFSLDYRAASDVQLAFFGAYFLGSLVYYLLSRGGADPIQRIGYKRGLLAGSLLSALGCALFVPATYLHVYGAYLGALFVLGLGFTLLQIAANPFVAIIGPEASASSRLNLAQAFNSLGTTLAPIIGGTLIFETFRGPDAVRWPYAFFALLLVAAALIVWRTPLPEPPYRASAARPQALRHRQLRWGMVAIFCYVGAEVAVGSMLINYLGSAAVLGLPEADAKHYLSLYWGGAMTGRFLGAVALAKDVPAARRTVGLLGLGAVMFALLYALNTTGGFGWTHLWPMAVLIAVNAAAFLLAGPHPARALGLFAAVAAVLLGITTCTSGAWALWAVVAVGLFNSILWSNIFTLAIDGLREDTSQGSSLLVMMIVGGAVVPKLQAHVTDALAVPADPDAGLPLSFLLPAACYLYLAWYGFRGSRHTSLPA